MKKISELTICWMLFGACLWIYQGHGPQITSNDNIPHTLLAFNWLENHTLNFDNFRNSYFWNEGVLPYFFSEAPNGHLTSTYPIGTELVTFPLYLLFFIYLKITALLHLGSSTGALELTSTKFEQTRWFFGRLAATVCSSLSVILLYLSLRIKFSRATALLTTFTYGFATTTWVLGSQDLRQHTVSNLLLTALILCLLKANRTTEQSRKILLVLTGIFCGLLPSVRLTSTIFAAAAIIYAFYAYRRQAIYLLPGLLSILPNWIWNSYYFGIENFSRGGYLKQFESGASGYTFSIDYFFSAFWGQLVSPSDGLFIYSPVLLVSLLGFYIAFRNRAQPDEQMLLCLSFACLGLFLHYCFYRPWDGGGGSYGPRFLTDILPVACFLLGYGIDWITSQTIAGWPPKLTQVMLSVFLMLLFWSTAVEMLGAFTATLWGEVPLPLINQPGRRWQLSDSQIERHFRRLLVQIASPIHDPTTYRQGLNGEIEQLELIRKNGTIQPVGQTLVMPANKRQVFRATLKNTGQSPWFGYQTALQDDGETRLQVSWTNAVGRRIEPRRNELYISGQPQPGEAASAIGMLNSPRQPDRYQMTFWLIMEGVKHNLAAKPFAKPLYTINVTVEPKAKKSEQPESSTSALRGTTVEAPIVGKLQQIAIRITDID